MSRQRFQEVLGVLRFDDAEYRRQHRSDDKLEPTRECFGVNTLRDGNVPGSMLTVDEELVTFREGVISNSIYLSNQDAME